MLGELPCEFDNQISDSTTTVGSMSTVVPLLEGLGADNKGCRAAGTALCRYRSHEWLTEFGIGIYEDITCWPWVLLITP